MYACLLGGGGGDAVMSSSDVRITGYVSVRAVVFTCSQKLGVVVRC